MEKFDLLLAKLIGDTTSGSEELLPKALDVIVVAIEEAESNEKLRQLLRVLVDSIRQNLPEMITLQRLADEIEKLPDTNLREELLLLEEGIRAKRKDEASSVAQLAANLIRENSTVASISHSSTVLQAFFKTRDSGIDFHVIVPVGEPAREGYIAAKKLAEKGIDVTIVPDAGIAIAARKADLILVGADAIAREFFLNKLGTLPLAIAAKHYGVPFYVCARLEKFVPQDKLPHRIRTIFSTELEYPKNELITTGAPLFERTPHSLVTGIVTEGGIVTPARGIVEIMEDSYD